MSFTGVTQEDAARATNSIDVSSLSNPASARATHLDLEVELSFEKKTISGTASYQVEILAPNTTYVAFDCKVRSRIK